MPPVYGLYTSFYPVLVYIIFGTSRHLSIGTVAVLSLVVGNMLHKLDAKYVPPVGFNASSTDLQIDTSNFLSNDRVTAQIMVVAANAFWVGLVQIVMFFFQLGFVTSYLSEPLVNGFLTGSAVHVLTSQLGLLFGISLQTYSGAFKIPKVVYIIIFYLISLYYNSRISNLLRLGLICFQKLAKLTLPR